MDSNIFFNTFIFLVAACIAVPLASRFKLGSVLGYLAAGVFVGPFGVGLIGNANEIMEFAEFGVVMMLFLIGLELEPDNLWRLRKSIVGLGGLQVTITSAVFTLIGIGLGFDWRFSLACGMALSLSSTALVLQMLEEKDLLKTTLGESSFAVLLFQDIAVIPILIIMPLMAGVSASGQGSGLLAKLSGWQHAGVVALVIAAVVISGRYLSRYMFFFIAKTNLREIFTATSLALILGITLLMNAIGVSPALGAFVAGVMLANSEYKQTLESDIQPFKGLLLGLFFISVGMGMNFSLLASEPSQLLACVGLLIAIKVAILFFLGKNFGIRGAQKIGFALALCQGSEFAFVLFQFAHGLHIIDGHYAAFFSLVVALSMAATPLLMIFYSNYILPRAMSAAPAPKFDTINHSHHPVVIAGYGRFGQIVGRFLSLQKIQATILEKDPDQIEQLRRYGVKGYFGDATRLDLLRSAITSEVKLLVVAIDDPDKAVEIVRLVRHEFPHVKVFARARNRRHAYELDKAGAHYFRRETFDSSVTMAQAVIKALDYPVADIERKARQFIEFDEMSLQKSFAFFEKDKELINFAKSANKELERILEGDIKDSADYSL